MKTSLDCMACFVRQSLEAARFVTSDPSVQERLLRDVLRWAAEMDLAQPPPVVGREIHRRLRQIAGVDDPYRPAKDRFNAMALDMLPELERRIERSDEPFGTALRLAIAGNVIDLGVDGTMTVAHAREVLAGALSEPFAG
ncbi:MAG: DUF89 family protein, partial [Planctomycetes bacterium]|nr:DUF89 family protein [Planctomycetota bacterium]